MDSLSANGLVEDELGKTLGEWLIDRAEDIDEILYAEPLIREQDRFLKLTLSKAPS